MSLPWLARKLARYSLIAVTDDTRRRSLRAAIHRDERALQIHAAAQRLAAREPQRLVEP
jgi:hypothetical protein